MTARITNKRVDQFLAYYKKNPAWGVFHCSLDDGNFDCGAAELSEADRTPGDGLDDMVEWFNDLTERERESLLKRVKAKLKGAPIPEPPAAVSPAPSVPVQSREERLKHAFEYRLAAAEQRLTQWTKDLNDHPKHAFEWSDTAFEAAAEIFVLKSALSVLSKCDFAEFVAIATRRVVEGTRDRSRSTSTPANHLSACVVAAWAHVVHITDTIPE